MLTKSEIKEIKENHQNAKTKYMSSYGYETDYKKNLCFINVQYNWCSYMKLIIAQIKYIL